jgi:uncharacterized coiled-coil protein SlyX
MADRMDSFTAARRAAYLRSAVQLRALAEKAQDTEARRMLMQLAVLYEELAEYAATSATRRPADEADPPSGQPPSPGEADEADEPDAG